MPLRKNTFQYFRDRQVDMARAFQLPLSEEMPHQCSWYLINIFILPQKMFFSYSLTASDGSEESTAGRVVSLCSIMMHHGFRSKEARRARKQQYRLLKTTSHSSLLVTRQGDVSRKLNQAFLLIDSFNFNFVDEERSYIYKNVLCFTSITLHLLSRCFN